MLPPALSSFVPVTHNTREKQNRRDELTKTWKQGKTEAHGTDYTKSLSMNRLNSMDKTRSCFQQTSTRDWQSNTINRVEMRSDKVSCLSEVTGMLSRQNKIDKYDFIILNNKKSNTTFKTKNKLNNMWVWGRGAKRMRAWTGSRPCAAPHTRFPRLTKTHVQLSPSDGIDLEWSTPLQPARRN